MKRLGCLLCAAALLLAAVAFAGNATGRFDQKLSADKQIVHVLNRLTFGPHPGDAEQVRRLGVQKWIDLQLHPERVQENPVLESKLRPLETLKLAMWQIQEKYSPATSGRVMRPPAAQSILTPQQFGRLMNCSVEDRRTLLTPLRPEDRRVVLANVPPQVLEGLPEDWVQEAAKARQAEQEARQKEFRRLMPPLTDLLSPEEVRTAQRGSREERMALLNSLDPEKRRQVLRVLPPEAFSDLPDLRREAMAVRQPQELVNSDLIENKLYRAIYSNRQLEEVLADFWMNHFNVFNGKGQDRVLLTSFERDAIRPHVFGHFKDMLLATARHPAVHDMGDRMEDIVLVTMSEFGRTVQEDGNGGTDHGHGNVMMVLGGPVRGGKVYGRWPGLEPEQLFEQRDLAITTDFRDVLGELVVRHLGQKMDQVFPDYTPGEPLGLL